MESREFDIELFPDKTDWERLAKPKSFKHLCKMLAASVRFNLAIFKGVRGKDVCQKSAAAHIYARMQSVK